MSTSQDPVRPAVVTFDAGAAPAWSTDPEEFRVPIDPAVAVVGDRILVGEHSSGDLTAFDARTGEPVWQLEAFSGRIGGGWVHGLPLVTSSAADGLVFAPYIEECWDHASCPDVPEVTGDVVGVAGLSAVDGEPVWRTVLAMSGPAGSATENDGIYLEATIVAADADGVLIMLGTNDGDPTPGGTSGTTAVLLDATTGAEQWRVDGFEPSLLTDDLVYGTVGPRRVSPVFVGETAVDRATGAVATPDRTWSGASALRSQGAGGPGVLVDREGSVDVGNLTVLGPQGTPVPTTADEAKWAMATCAEVDGLVCTVRGRDDQARLLSWYSGEPAPTEATLWNAHLQLWGTAGDDVLLMTENGYVTVNREDTETSWFAVARDGTVLGERRPGAVVAGSPQWVVTTDRVPVDDPKVWPFALQVWAVG